MHEDSASTPVRERLRAHMPVAQKYAYFDHAAVGPLPDSCAAAIRQYADQAELNGDALWLTWFAQLGKLRTSAAELLGADEGEIALVSNTTAGINLVAEGFPWKAGDNLVLPSNEFPSNQLAWRNLRRLGVEVREAAVPPSGTIDLDQLAATIDARTRLVAISWVGFSSGYRIDVAKVVELAHARECLVMLDAIQGLGAFPLNVRETGVDFVVADGHKWMLGPEGAGLFYCQAKHLDMLTPLGLGWNSLEIGAFDPAASQIKQTAARYEGGTTNMPGMLGFGASLELLLQAGANRSTSRVAETILNNVAQLEEWLTAADFNVHLPTRTEQRSGILGVTWGEASDCSDALYASARKHLLERDVVTSVRGGRLRISTHAYNNESDFRRLVDGLTEFRNGHGG